MMPWLAIAIGALLVQSPAPQNPSPMTDTTRPHPRLSASEPAGTRRGLTQGTWDVRPGLQKAARLPLIVHFHVYALGAWLARWTVDR